MSFLKIPYLPQSKVTIGIGDINCESIEIVPPCDFLNLPEGCEISVGTLVAERIVRNGEEV